MIHAPRSLIGALTIALWTLAHAVTALAAKSDKIEELVALHDLKTAVAIGNYYLKQRALVAVRQELERIGAEQKLGGAWNRANPRWQQAQSAMMNAVKQTSRDFASLEWLSEEWGALNDRAFTAPDIDYLLAHFHTEHGRKQIMIVDHGVAVHPLVFHVNRGAHALYSVSVGVRGRAQLGAGVRLIPSPS